MPYEVVVVGAGIGGLTAAALLAARGVSVCVLERESRGGGCAGGFEKFGYRFETTAGLYAGWGEGDTHARVFAELPVEPPTARKLTPAYVVRLGDGTDVRVSGDAEEFGETLRAAFAECADAAVSFYRELATLGNALGRRGGSAGEGARARGFGRLRELFGGGGDGAARALAARDDTTAARLVAASARFRGFVDAQLEMFAQASSQRCPLALAAHALTLPRRGLYSLAGGAPALADALADSIRSSGGAVRFDATALRLAYDAEGRAAGVELLSGETVSASRAVVSNLTIWDTYGKLVGLSRTPANVRAGLKTLRGRGAYLLFLGMDERAAARLPAAHLIAAPSVADAGSDSDADPARTQFVFSSSPAWDARAPAGRRAVTVSTFADTDEWFAYHTDDAEHEAQDERTMGEIWARLHAAVPELGDAVEVVETLTPRGYHEWTRRRLGQVGAAWQSEATPATNPFTHRTAIPRLFAVGDTIAGGAGVEAVTRAALAVADDIAPAVRK
jgi:phytoene dehydrogenase-like protein